jgi:EmrB/QacA subfamily drug resistance transporter
VYEIDHDVDETFAAIDAARKAGNLTPPLGPAAQTSAWYTSRWASGPRVRRTSSKAKGWRPRVLEPTIDPPLSKSPITGAGPAAAPAQQSDRDFPDKLDAGVLRITGVCALTRMMYVLNLTMVGVAQRTFIEKFESNQTVVAWTLTADALALATAIPLAGWAADRFGTKRLFMGAVLAYTLGSLLCAMAPTITLLIAFRVIQGFACGVFIVLNYTILTSAAGPRRVGRLLAVMTIPALFVTPLGPILGGWLIDFFGWQWIFLINLPIGVTTVVLAAIVFPKDHSRASAAFDFVGMLLLSPGLAIFLLGVSAIPGRGTVMDGHVWLPVGIGLVLITAFVFHALYRPAYPLIDLRLLKNRVLRLGNLAYFLLSGVWVGVVLLLPSAFQQLLHQRPLQSGLWAAPLGFGALLIMPIAGRFVDKRGPAPVLLTGITLSALGLGTFAYGVYVHAAYAPILLTGLLIGGFGMGSTVVPTSAAVMRVLGSDQVARGSTMLGVNLQVANSVGAALLSVVASSQFNRSANITAANKFAILQHAADRRGVPLDPSAIPPQVHAPDFASAVLHDLSHAYAVVFAVAVVLVTLAYIPVALLLKKPPTDGIGPAGTTPQTASSQSAAR